MPVLKLCFRGIKGGFDAGQAWQVRSADAIATAEAIPIEGVRVPFLSLEMLIKSKTTCREQDRADLVRLRDLLELKRQRGDAAH